VAQSKTPPHTERQGTRSLRRRRQSSIRREPLQGILCTVVISHARFPIDEDLFAPYQVIGELGTRPIPLYVARQSVLAVGGAQLVVAEHFQGACKTSEAHARSDLRREARRISTLANPHLARVREVAVRGDDLVVFGEFLDGEKLVEFWRPGDWLPLEIALRTLLDVLTGVGALHGLRDSNQQPMKLTHGEISPATILLGADGVARVLHAVARRAADPGTEAASLPYLAPEVHANDAYDGRADVFSVGVLLWEVLEGKRLSNDGEEPAGQRVRSAPLPAPSTPEKTPWAKALVPVVTRALAAAPEDRWPTAAAMAAEIRKAAGLKLAAASAAAAFAKSKFGDRVKQRRARWEARSSRPPTPLASPRPQPVAALPPSAAAAVDPPGLAGASSAAADWAVPRSRSEEFSSSILESYRPPPPPSGSIDAPRAAGFDAPGTGVDAPRVIGLDAHEEAHEGGLGVARFAPPSVPPGEAVFSIPPPVEETASAASIPEPPPSAEVPFGAPVVFDDAEVAPIASPFGEPSPMPPALSTSGHPIAARSRRRQLVLGGVAAAGIAAVLLVAVRVTRHASAQPPAAAAAVAQPAAPVVVPQIAAAASASASAAPIASAAPPVTAAHPSLPKTKGGPKTKGPAVGASHPKSAPVRPQTRTKPGAT
jgi:eukaryotic-like serine/threonine-protein kinase